MAEGNVFVVTGPSGAGKDSVIDRVREMGLDFGSVTTTSTRPMRPGESEGNPYYFLSRDEFEQKVANGEMIEWAEVYDNFYGCTREEVDRVRRKHEVVIIKVDPQGARTYMDMIEDAKTIFIKPPSIEFLEKRLNKRATDAPDVIANRLKVAEEELQNLDQWDFVVVNEEDMLDAAAQEVIDIMKA